MTSKKQAAPYASYIHEYYAKIISGEIVVGAWILAVYKIIVAGLAAGEYFYDGKRALAVFSCSLFQVNHKKCSVLSKSS